MAVALKSKTFEVADPWDVVELAYEKGWTDGAPIVPPTAKKVAEFLEYLGREPQERIGYIPPKHGLATVETITTCCVMAGCKPEYVPIVITAFQTMLGTSSSDGGVTGEEAGRWFNLNGVIATANAVGPMLIVSGPVVKQLGFNSKTNAMGGGARANVTIGRAVRLIIHIIGGGSYGEIDMAPHGGPHKFASVIAEDQDSNPWEPVHVSLGRLDPKQSALTVFACNPHNGAYLGPARGDPIRMLRIMADVLCTQGHICRGGGGYQAVILSPLVANELAKHHWKKRDVQLFLWENARRSIREQLSHGAHRNENDEYDPASAQHVRNPWIDWSNLDSMVPCVADPNNFIVVVCGGDQDWWCAACHGWGELGGWPITVPLELPKKK